MYDTNLGYDEIRILYDSFYETPSLILVHSSEVFTQFYECPFKSISNKLPFDQKIMLTRRRVAKNAVSFIRGCRHFLTFMITLLFTNDALIY
jgi:hypothetical protein